MKSATLGVIKPGSLFKNSESFFRPVIRCDQGIKSKVCSFVLLYFHLIVQDKKIHICKLNSLKLKTIAISDKQQ